MELWRQTFGDSEEYVNLVFGTYFDPRFVEYEEREGRIVSALLGIPRQFGDATRRLSAIYLCGLATSPEFRGRGIMSRLLERVYRRFHDSEYSYIFLIPANRGLQQYYRDRGFAPAFYRSPSRYSSIHDFIREIRIKLSDAEDGEEKLILANLENFKVRRLNNEEMSDNDIPNRIIRYVTSTEEKRPGMGIIHDSNDMSAAIEECRLSGGDIYIVENPEREICALSFLYPGASDISIYFMRNSDEISRALMLQKIKNDFADSEIYICNDLAQTAETQIRSKYFASAMTEAPTVGSISERDEIFSREENFEIYGMSKILSVSEILKFLNKIKGKLKYSILVKNEISGKIIRYSSDKRNGFSYREEEPENVNPEEVMSERQLATILFRRAKREDMVDIAFGLPSLEGEISLMLD